jgi:multimeric flavodoxin WrbA
MKGDEMTNDVLRFVGLSMSPRATANTEGMLEAALRAGVSYAESVGLDARAKMVSLAGKELQHCRHCDACVKAGSYCVLQDDWLELVRQLIDPIPDGVMVGSPVYFFHVTSLGRAFMERFTSLLKRRWHESFPYDPPDFSASAAGAVAVGTGRNSGIEHTLSDILDWLLMLDFVVVGGANIGAGGWTQGATSRDAVKQDSLGLEAATCVGEKVARAAAMLRHGKRALGSALRPIGWGPRAG